MESVMERHHTSLSTLPQLIYRVIRNCPFHNLSPSNYPSLVILIPASFVTPTSETHLGVAGPTDGVES
jgi:hypothetical protein